MAGYTKNATILKNVAEKVRLITQYSLKWCFPYSTLRLLTGFSLAAFKA
jgi:hypothetical protein